MDVIQLHLSAIGLSSMYPIPPDCVILTKMQFHEADWIWAVDLPETT